MKPISADPMGVAFAKLTVLDGPDRGKTFELGPGRSYLAGRSEECDIRINMSDKTVSRKHALLTLSGNTINIENLSQTNPVQVKGKSIKKISLKHKGQFQIGAGLFTFETSVNAETRGSGKQAPLNLKIVIPAALILVIMIFFLIAGSGKQDTAKTDGLDITRPGMVQPDAPPALERPASSLPKGPGIVVSGADREKADAHFRQGMFFYDTGNIARAVEEWGRVIAIHPDHPEAQSWYLRAERELDEKIKTHYQSGMLHYKYMRYRDAAHEFGIVVELSRNKNSDHYVNALRYINELQGK